MTVASYQINLPASPKGELPGRLPILPAGPTLYGKDMRSWRIGDPYALLRRLEGRTLVLDENHSTYLKAPRGESAPALARLSNFSLQSDGSVWANTVEWTKYGKETYASGGYLGLSPVILFDPSHTADDTALGEVVDIHSMALVNDPNLPMPALNAAEVSMSASKTETPIVPPVVPPPFVMPDFAALFSAALAPVVELLSGLKVSIEALQPAAHQAAANAASLDSHGNAVKAALEGFISAGKISNDDASRNRFLAHCTTPADLAREVTHYGNAPTLVALNAANLNAPLGEKKYSEAQTRIAKLFGRTPDQIKD